jgi:hypothetical protein
MHVNSDNTIIATIGRMNPPTIGHSKLIKFMLSEAISYNLTQINIILSDTFDNTKNPFDCEEKRMILYNSIIDNAKNELIQEYGTNEEIKTKIKDIKVEIVCMDDEIDLTGHKILNSIFYILSLYGYDIRNESQRRTNLSFELVIGQDREGGFNFIGKILSELTPTINFREVVLPRSEGSMSATKVRNMALSGDESAFLHHYESMGIKNEDALRLYEQIRENITEPLKKRIKTENGGRRRKNKKSKRKRNKKGSVKIRRK